MTEILTDRTTQFTLRPGEEFEIRIKGREIEDVWTVTLDSFAPFKGKTSIELRLLVIS